VNAYFDVQEQVTYSVPVVHQSEVRVILLLENNKMSFSHHFSISAFISYAHDSVQYLCSAEENTMWVTHPEFC
jgi:hypothetical protein